MKTMNNAISRLKNKFDKNFDHEKVIKYLKIFVIISVVIVMFSGVMTVKALLAEEELSEELIVKEIEKNINYDYRVNKQPSILYPEGTEPLEFGAKEVYFTSLVDDFEIIVEGEISKEPSSNPDGDMDISLYLFDEERWEYEMEPQIDIKENNSEDGVSIFKSSLTLPVDEALGIKEAISEETGVRPRDVKFVVKSELETPPLEDDEQPGVLASDYSLAIDDNIIEPGEEESYENSSKITEEITETNYLGVLGISMKVSQGRTVFPVLTLFFLAVCGFGTYVIRQKQLETINAGKLEFNKIKKRYGKRIIETKEFNGDISEKAKIKVSSFEELIKISDEIEKPILQYYQAIGGGSKSIFYLISDGIMYCYEVDIDHIGGR